MDNPVDDTAVTFEQQVLDAVKVAKATPDANGKPVLKEDLSPEVAFAAKTELRRQQTFDSFNKANGKATALEAENTELLKLAAGAAPIEVTPERQKDLDELKFSDPEAWRKQMGELEEEARKRAGEAIKEVSAKSVKAAELKRRETVFAAFKSDNPETKLNDNTIANEIPPRITKKLEDGSITFEAFLQEAEDYLNAGKVVHDEPTPEDADLSATGGGADPADYAGNKQTEISYKDSII